MRACQSSSQNIIKELLIQKNITTPLKFECQSVTLFCQCNQLLKYRHHPVSRFSLFPYLGKNEYEYTDFRDGSVILRVTAYRCRGHNKTTFSKN